jgi:tyrosine-protein kinase Etk/Wzc
MDKGSELTPGTGKSNDSHMLSVFDLFLIVVRRKKLILAVTGLTSLVVVILTALSLALPASANYLPNQYMSEAIIILKSPTGSNSGSGSSSLSQISSLAAITGISVNTEADSNSNLVISLIKQNTFLDQLSAELEFSQRMHIKDITKATIFSRKILSKSLSTKYDKETGMITVKFSNTDREFTTKAVNSAVEILQKRFNEISLNYSREKLSLIQGSIEQARGNMETAQKTFTNFQKKYGLYDLESSTSASFGLLQSAGNDLLKLQMEYNNLRGYRNAGDPQLARLQQQIEQQKEQIKSLKQGNADLSALNIAIDQMPDIVAEYLILKQELAIQQGIYASLRQQYEFTQIEEISGSKIFTILEKAEIPLEKSGPSRGMICIVAVICAFLISIFASFILEYLKIVQSDPENERKIKEISGLLRFWKTR